MDCSQKMKRRRMMKDCSETMIVAEELLIAILLRLPVKSLARFKCVSKLWFSLISDSSFARSHYDLALAPTHTHLLSSGDCLEIASIDFNAPSLHDYTTEIFRPPIPQLPPHCYPRFLGSCRGFILLDLNSDLELNSDLYIWNPCTGVQRRIPSPPSYVNPLLGFKGFGYDSSTDDYLVTLGYSNQGIKPKEIRVVIFSVRANAWRQFDGIIPETLKYLDRVIASWGALFVNGAIHWIALGLGPGAPEEVMWDVIVGFHLTERVFFEIALPDGFPAFVLHPVIGGFLSVLPMNWPETDYKLLVMEEYNRAQSSWKYLPFPNHLQSEQGLDPHPLLVTVGGDIVAVDTGFRELIKLNGKGQVLERRDYHDYPDRADPHRFPRDAVVHMHTHTLLSLPCQAQDV